MNIPTTKKDLLAALARGPAKLRREIVELLSENYKNKNKIVNPIKEKDNSIIDVTNESYIIPQPIKSQIIQSNNSDSSNQIKPKVVVPYWEHQYVYSYSEIYNATDEQKEFYNYFKSCFLRKEFVDLEGNSNYSFILLFDLLKRYQNHKNISILEHQLRLLGEFYPKTNSYALHFLAQHMEAVGDRANAERVRYEHQLAYYDYWKLGSKYRKKLSLTTDEVKTLNKINYSSNNFTDIEYCCIEIIKLYLASIVKLENLYLSEQTNSEEQFEFVADVIARKHFRYRYNSQNYRYCLETTPGEIYTLIFKHCENAVREYYGHKRKLNVSGYYTHPEVQTEFESRIIEKLNGIIARLILRVNPPDEATELELNSQNTTRWKIKFAELTANYKGDGKWFVESILKLGKLNVKNPAIENIFFEASKFISKTDKVSSLTLYMYYLHYDLKSATFDNKQFTKTIQKSLFKTNEQLHDFQVIVSEFLHDNDLEIAVSKIPEIYVPKRKKIKLDTAVIREVQQQHSGTVELLNEYLHDEFEDHTSSIKSREISDEEIRIEITCKGEPVSETSSIFTGEIAFTPLHREVLELFFKNGLTLLQSDLEDFAKSRSAFRNQLIDSINETCYDVLDDVLIEEADNFYTINENYYKKLLAEW